MAPRRLLQVRLTDKARAGWDKAAVDEGATVTALLEAIGLGLAERERLPRHVVRTARKIDKDRRSR